MRKLVHDAFEVGITIKFLDGILEVIGGVLILIVPPVKIGTWLASLTEHELIRNWILSATSHPTGFALFYLFSHGLVKIFIVICLWQKRLWAYPTAIAFFTFFGVYQTYRFFLSHSLVMFVLTILDIIIITLTYLEYQNIKLKLDDSGFR